MFLFERYERNLGLDWKTLAAGLNDRDHKA